MDLLRNLEPVLFSYQFLQCEKDPSVYYSRLDETNYMVIRMFGNHTIDILHESYSPGEDPCNGKPLNDATIKLSFEPGRDEYILKEFYEKWEK
jgi:hypothetical protein